MRVLAGYGEILKENNSFLSGQTSLLDFCKSPTRTFAWPPVLLDTGDDDQDDIVIVFKECHPRCVGELDRWEGSQKHNSYLI